MEGELSAGQSSNRWRPASYWLNVCYLTSDQTADGVVTDNYWELIGFTLRPPVFFHLLDATLCLAVKLNQIVRAVSVYIRNLN